MAMINSNLFSVSYGGIPIVGFADGDAVSFEGSTTTGQVFEGVRGESAIVITQEGTGTLTVRLHGTSKSIDTVVQTHLAALGTITAPIITYKKIVGVREVVITGDALLENLPAEKSSNDNQVVELKFVIAALERN